MHIDIGATVALISDTVIGVHLEASFTPCLDTVNLQLGATQTLTGLVGQVSLGPSGE